MVRVSVIIPTYNREEYVQQAIDSVLAQTYTDYEIIVVDDGSTDGTRAALARYGDRIRYIYQENQGESAARNHGLVYAQGEFVAFLDDDDVWLPGKLECLVQLLDERPDVSLVASQGFVIDEHGTISKGLFAFPRQSTGYVDFAETLLNSSVGPSNSLIRRQVLYAVGLFDESLRYGEDWDLMLRIARCYQIMYLNEPLVCMRSQVGRQSDFWLNHTKALSRFKDHLQILEKMKDLCSSTEMRLLDKAVAREYAEVAINDIANGKVEAGRKHLTEALRLDETTWLHGSDLETLALAYAHALVAGYGEDSARRFLVELFKESFPQNRLWVQKMRKSLAHLYEDLAFIAAQKHDWCSVRNSTIRAIRYEPRCMFNRGLVSVALASFMAFESVAAIKKRVRSIIANHITRNRRFK